MDTTLTGAEMSELLSDVERAADAYVRGDMDEYLRLVHHAPGFTLLAPYGGPATRHEDRAAEIRSNDALFGGGEATLEHVEAHTWGDTVVLAMIERQHGRLRDLPDQEWPLRVTHVYRRDGDEWRLVHRHADPLVRPIGLEDLRALAQGPRQEDRSRP